MYEINTYQKNCGIRICFRWKEKKPAWGKKYIFLFYLRKKKNGIDIDSPQFPQFRFYHMMFNVRCFLSFILYILNTEHETWVMSMHSSAYSIYALLFAWFPTILYYYYFSWVVVDCRLSPTAFIVCALQTPNNAIKNDDQRNWHCIVHMIHKSDKWIVWQASWIELEQLCNWSIRSFIFTLFISFLIWISSWMLFSLPLVWY